MSDRICSAVFRRCALVLGTDGEFSPELRLTGSVGQVKPTLSADGKEASFDFASGFNSRPIPSGEWVVSGAVCDRISAIDADFSGDGTAYQVKVWAENGSLQVKVDYTPRKESFKERVSDLLMQGIYLLGRAARFGRPRVIFTSESRRDPSGNMAFVLDAAKKLGIDNRAPLIFSFNKGGSRALFYALTAFKLGRCDTVVIDDYYPLIYHLKFSKDTRIFQLWHACGAYKTTGYSRAGKQGAPRIDGNSHRCYTHAIVSSPAVRAHYAEAFGIPTDNVYATGVPRTDIFFDSEYAQKQKSELLKLLPQAADKQIVLFAPTFRGDGKQSAHYPTKALDLGRLAEFCRQTGRFVIFKMHPFVKGFSLPEGYEDVFADLQDMREVNDLLFCADLLITDYSSVIYEAALLDLDILLYVFDLEEYIASRDFYEPFDRYVAGKAVCDFDGLIEALREGDFDAEKRAEFRRYSMDSCDSHASERVARMIFGE